ncbi:hypothetical protein [Opitutus sp. ER46]|uniref:hypothetical protein n=1 Tax=Opitutus sp. ER46 TaxID=2161864 RepID=UPI000D30D258|nr:hypothetical protein [Opitutus sp. ER46]PTX98641.1 hypothetical protein DB354_05095 [Opitutus sp. ER46]
MATILHSPFFLLFCTTSAAAAYLAHRRYVVRAKPTWGDQVLNLIAAFETLALLYTTYQIRNGNLVQAVIDPGAATIVAGVTALGVAMVTFEGVLASNEASEEAGD